VSRYSPINCGVILLSLGAKYKYSFECSVSATELELVAAQNGLLRQELPSLDFWGKLQDAMGVNTTWLGVLLDNAAMVEIVRTGHNLSMRRLSKIHGISIAWLHEQYESSDV
jgi:hypothetical protein